jgi:hypothetical protein
MAHNIAGWWTIIQANTHNCVVFVTQQPDGKFDIHAKDLRDGNEGNGTGLSQTTQDGDVVSFIVHWGSGARGGYNGNFGPDRVLHGAAFDMANPGSTTEWHSDKPF